MLALPCDKSFPNLHGLNELLSSGRTEPETPGIGMCAADLLLLPWSSSVGCSPSALSATPVLCVNGNVGGEGATLQLAG